MSESSRCVAIAPISAVSGAMPYRPRRWRICAPAVSRRGESRPADIAISFCGRKAAPTRICGSRTGSCTWWMADTVDAHDHPRNPALAAYSIGWRDDVCRPEGLLAFPPCVAARHRIGDDRAGRADTLLGAP